MKKIIMLMVCMSMFLLASCAERAAEQKVSGIKSQVYLSDLEPFSSIGNYLKDINRENHPIFIRGSKFKKGLCVNSNSELTYDLNGKYNYFKCIIGHHDDFPEYRGKLRFTVLADGKKIYESAAMTAKDFEAVNLKVKDVKHLTLTVKDNGIGSSYVIWADARVFNK